MYSCFGFGEKQEGDFGDMSHKLDEAAEILGLHCSSGVDMDNKVYISFRGVEVSEGRFLTSFSGRGNTPDEAKDNYYEQIRGKLLIKDAHYETRREIVIL